jgi:hypothetical protein
MYNAELVTRRSPGVSIEPRAYPEATSEISENYERMLPIAQAANNLVELKATPKVVFDAYTGVIAHSELLTALDGLHWMTSEYFEPDLNFLREIGNGRLKDWMVIIPLRRDHVSSAVMLPGLGRRSVFERNRQEAKSFGAIAEPRHREPAKFIAGVDLVGVDDQVINSYAARNRGAMLFYPVVTKGHPRVEKDALERSDVFMCFELWAPITSCPPGSRLVQFRVRNQNYKDQAIVDTGS